MKRLLVLLTIALSACDVPTAPRDAVAIVPPAHYRVWWGELETCSGLTGDFDRVQFYAVPVLVYDGRRLTGLWMERGNKIILADMYLNVHRVVRHEMMHALRQAGSHPTAYFNGPCGNLLS